MEHLNSIEEKMHRKVGSGESFFFDFALDYDRTILKFQYPIKLYNILRT